jgi:hypothetical protein
MIKYAKEKNHNPHPGRMAIVYDICIKTIENTNETLF